MIVLALDTATPDTVVALLRADGDAVEAADRRAPGERPRHTTQVLTLAHEVLERAGLSWRDVDRIAVGTGPGSFTGLRVGVATARALALAADAELAGVSTLRALALPAGRGDPARTVLAVVDARRGEAFAAAFRGARQVAAPAALPPGKLAELSTENALAVGDGAVRFRAVLEGSGTEVPPDESPLHRLSAAAVAQLGAAAAPAAPEAIVPEYLRLPDAELARRARRPT